jgi:MFS family permease
MAVALAFALAGSLVTALAGTYGVFVAGRAVTGVAMGAMLSVANTYVGEIAPARARARYTARTFVLCALGATCGIGIGLLLTTPAAPWPQGLPVALTAECFPTRIRSAGFGLVDGLAVSGGAVGVLVIAPLVPHLSSLQALLLISGFLVLAAVLAQFTPRARNRALEDLSP